MHTPPNHPLEDWKILFIYLYLLPNFCYESENHLYTSFHINDSMYESIFEGKYFLRDILSFARCREHFTYRILPWTPCSIENLQFPFYKELCVLYLFLKSPRAVFRDLHVIDEMPTIS